MARLPAFGYIRIHRGASTEELGRFRRQMDTFVASQGFVFCDVFVEAEDSTTSAFAALIDSLRASEIAVVVVPSMNHFGHMESVRAAMKQRIETETGARILIAAPAGDCAHVDEDSHSDR